MAYAVVHRLEYSLELPVTIQQAWEFFSNPLNLRLITPAELDFVIVSQLPESIYPGLMIEYRVRPLCGLRMHWLTEITHVRAPHYFVDEQRMGPYRMWHHEHFLESTPDGSSTVVRDLVHYILPMSPLTEWAHPVIVAPQLKKIFDFRANKLKELFAKSVT